PWAHPRVGRRVLVVAPDRIFAIVKTEHLDSPSVVADPDADTKAIAKHIIGFFEQEVAAGRLTPSLLPLQVRIGSIANAVTQGLTESNFRDLVMYSEVLQDSAFHLLASGQLAFAPS